MPHGKKQKPYDRDYNFYLENRRKFNFCGQDVKESDFIYSESGATAKIAFKALDSNGKNIPCSEVQLLREIVICKKAINMQIKQYAEGFYDFCEPIEFYMRQFINPPKWVGDAIYNLKWKIHG